MGAIFCQVNKIKQFIQLRPSTTSGNQKWNGAIPIFVIKAEFIIIEVSLNKKIMFSKEETMILKIKIIEAKAWIIKYFNADSEE